MFFLIDDINKWLIDIKNLVNCNFRKYLNYENIFYKNHLKILLNKYWFKNIFIDNIEILDKNLNDKLKDLKITQVYQLVQKADNIWDLQKILENNINFTIVE